MNLLQHESTCFYFVLALQDGELVQFLPVDAATDYRRDGRVWFSAEELLEGRRRWKEFWVASPEVEFRYLLVKKILKEQLPEHAAVRLQELAQELGQKADALAEGLLGQHWAHEVMTWIRIGQWELSVKTLPVLKRVLRRYKLLKDPLNPVRYYLPEIKRIWQRWFHPTGFWVVVLGPDGSGKSTLIGKLERELKGAFRRTAVFHLMPGLFRRRGDGGPVTDPHGKPPRSLPTSLLKLFYYLVDYNLGYWLKIRMALVRSALVLFDRYYDDLLIDPRRYRYGGAMRLARWLRHLIPRPDLFLVLDAPVERLLERKQEVEPEALRRQVEAYRAFALETPNAYLLDASLPAEEVARHAREIILDALHRRYLSRRHLWFPSGQGNESDYFAKALGVEISPGQPTHAWLRLPDGRGYFLPLRNGRVFRRGLDLYPAQGRKARLGKAVLGAPARLGIKGPGLPKVHLNEQENSVFQSLRQAFGRDDLSFAVSLGTPRPHRKPVIQVLTPQGDVLGYAKVGWNEETRKLVKHEAQVLKRLAKASIPFGIPRVLHTTGGEGLTLRIQSPPPGNARPAPRKLTPAYIDALCGLASTGVVWRRLEETEFWKTIGSRVAQVQNPYWRCQLEQAMERVRREWEGKEVPLHLAHGDFTPWNAFSTDGKVYLYDWEYAMDEAPAGYDLFHFLLQTLWLVEGRAPHEIVRVAFELSRRPECEAYWKVVNGEREDWKKLMRLYSLERFSFSSSTQPFDSARRTDWAHFTSIELRE